MPYKFTAIGADGNPALPGQAVLVERPFNTDILQFGPNQVKPRYGNGKTTLTLFDAQSRELILDAVLIITIINGNTGLAFTGYDDLKAFISATFFRKASANPGGGASTADVITDFVNNGLPYKRADGTTGRLVPMVAPDGTFTFQLT